LRFNKSGHGLVLSRLTLRGQAHDYFKLYYPSLSILQLDMNKKILGLFFRDEVTCSLKVMKFSILEILEITINFLS